MSEMRYDSLSKAMNDSNFQKEVEKLRNQARSNFGKENATVEGKVNINNQDYTIQAKTEYQRNPFKKFFGVKETKITLTSIDSLNPDASNALEFIHNKKGFLRGNYKNMNDALVLKRLEEFAGSGFTENVSSGNSEKEKEKQKGEMKKFIKSMDPDQLKSLLFLENQKEDSDLSLKFLKNNKESPLSKALFECKIINTNGEIIKDQKKLKKHANELEGLLYNRDNQQQLSEKLSEKLAKIPTYLLPAVLSTPDDNGWTPLHSAAENGKMKEVIGALGNTGISKNNLMNLLQTSIKNDNPTSNGYGWTPIHIAAANGKMADFIGALGEVGIDENNLMNLLQTQIQNSPNKNWNGKTPLHIVVSSWNQNQNQNQEQAFWQAIENHYPNSPKLKEGIQNLINEAKQNQSNSQQFQPNSNQQQFVQQNPPNVQQNVPNSPQPNYVPPNAYGGPQQNFVPPQYYQNPNAYPQNPQGGYPQNLYNQPQYYQNPNAYPQNPQGGYPQNLYNQPQYNPQNPPFPLQQNFFPNTPGVQGGQNPQQPNVYNQNNPGGNPQFPPQTGYQQPNPYGGHAQQFPSNTPQTNQNLPQNFPQPQNYNQAQFVPQGNVQPNSPFPPQTSYVQGGNQPQFNPNSAVPQGGPGGNPNYPQQQSNSQPNQPSYPQQFPPQNTPTGYPPQNPNLRQ